jgi:AcrR family transcriptional regulator
MIIRHAVELFDNVGYHETRMEEVAVAAGIRKSTLYHYFGSKDDLLLSIHDEFMEVLTLQLEQPGPPEPSPTEFLHSVLTKIVETVHTHPHHGRVFLEHYRELPEPARSLLQQNRDRYADRVEQVIQIGIESGEFRKMNPRLAMFAFFGVCNWTYTWYRPKGPLGLAEVTEFLWTFALRGLTDEGVERNLGGASA